MSDINWQYDFDDYGNDYIVSARIVSEHFNVRDCEVLPCVTNIAPHPNVIAAAKALIEWRLGFMKSEVVAPLVIGRDCYQGGKKLDCGIMTVDMNKDVGIEAKIEAERLRLHNEGKNPSTLYLGYEDHHELKTSIIVRLGHESPINSLHYLGLSIVKVNLKEHFNLV